jgi:hypothetical protein
MRAIPVWDIDGALESYRLTPEKVKQEVEMQHQLLFRFMNDKGLLTRNIVGKDGKLKVRKLYTKDFTRLGNSFMQEYEAKWFGSNSSSDPVKGPKLLEKYLKELRGKRKRRG